MLKIKDSVDLKELEKYGFEKLKGFSDYHYGDDISAIYVEMDRTIIVATYQDYDVKNKILEIIYDLIKDGLVEKVV